MLAQRACLGESEASNVKLWVEKREWLFHPDRNETATFGADPVEEKELNQALESIKY
jgi:hypothetical protein